jgi:hypothetical protein
MVKSERKFASDVTMSVPRSVLKGGDETSEPTGESDEYLFGTCAIPTKDLGGLFPFHLRLVMR